MLKKQSRLNKRKDFRKVFAAGKTFFSPVFVLRYGPNEFKTPRLAVVISAKISKKAVARNRLKRQLREIIRLDLGTIKNGYDVVISVKPAALNLSYQQLKQGLFSALTKARLKQ